MTKYLPLLLVLVVTSCMYSNDEVYVSPIEPPTGSGAAINLNIQEEPIVLHDDAEFMFTVSPVGKGHYQAVILVDNQQLYNWESTDGRFYFTLSPGIIGSGEKTLTVRVRYSTLSSSLAGQLDTETLTVTESWQVIVDISQPAALAAPAVYLEDGKSMLAWELPNRFSFTELILVRTYLKVDGTFQYRDSIKFEDHRTTLYHDARYVGGRILYSVDIKGYNYYVKGREREFNITPLTFTRDVMAERPVLSWNKSPLYGNELVISQDGRMLPIDQPGSLESSPRFGLPDHFTFTILPTFTGAHRYEVSASIWRGLRLPTISSICYLQGTNVYLLKSGRTLYKLDGVTLDTLQTATLSADNGQSFVTSANGEHVYLYHDDKLERVDVSSLNIEETADISVLTGQSNQGFGALPVVSNDNLVSFKLTGRNVVYVIDLETLQILWQKSGVYPAPILSPDSKFLYWRGSVYSNRESNWSTLAGTISASATAWKEHFNSNAPHELIVYTTSGNLGYTYNLDAGPSGEGVYLPVSSFDNYLFVDPVSGSFYRKHYYASYVGRIEVMDSDRATIRRTLDGVHEPDNFFYLNNHFFHRNGHYLP